jgi:zinc transport system substrate-binding protein
MKQTLKLTALVLCLFAVACQKSETQVSKDTQQKLIIVTTLFPLYDFARIIGGDKADVNLIIPPGVEAHSFEPKPEDALRVSKADLFVFTNEYMEPWAAKFAGGVTNGKMRLVDSSSGVRFLRSESGSHDESHGSHKGKPHSHAEGKDPHVWLDFSNAAIMVDNIAAAIVARDPANRDYYMSNASLLRSELAKLDNDFKAGLSSCSKRVILHGGHYAFGYMSKRYGIHYESASAVNADAEPTPAKLIGLVRQVRAMDLKYIFSEELLSLRVSEMIAKEAGVSVLMLHGAHNISREDFNQGPTFIKLMRKNLETLRTGMQCS